MNQLPGTFRSGYQPLDYSQLSRFIESMSSGGGAGQNGMTPQLGTTSPRGMANSGAAGTERAILSGRPMGTYRGAFLGSNGAASTEQAIRGGSTLSDTLSAGAYGF